MTTDIRPLKETEKELLIKASQKNKVIKNKVIYTHYVYVNNADLSNNELEILNNLVNEMVEKDFCVVLNGKVFYPYISEYSGGTALAGIRMGNVLN